MLIIYLALTLPSGSSGSTANSGLLAIPKYGNFTSLQQTGFTYSL